MSPYILITAIVPKEKGEFIAKTATNCGAGGGTLLLGRGTASSNILSVLGIGDVSREIFLCVTQRQKKQKIIEGIKQACSKTKIKYGIIYTVDVVFTMQKGKTQKGEYQMQPTGQKLITVIINKGFAEDAMAQARKAGANGGTILDARGTAKPQDAKFFGIPIVPEKEVLLLIVNDSKLQNVFDALKSLPCLSTPASGIIYCEPVEDFCFLGKGK